MLIYLIPVLIISGIVCYEDLRYGLIRNKYTASLLVIFLLYFFLNFSVFANSTFMIHLFWTIFIGMFLYLIDLWSAGDGKFFIALSLLFPVEMLSSRLYFNFLINSSVPLFFGFLILIFIKTKKSEIKKAFKSAFSLYNIFLITSIYVGMCWFLILPLSFIGIPANIFTFIIILFVVIEIINRFIHFNMEYLYIILVVLRLVLDFRTVFTYDFLTQLVLILFVFLFFRFFVLRMGFKMNVKKVRIKDLKNGMETAEGIIKIGGKYEKIPLFQVSFYDFMVQKKRKFIHSKTLNEDDIKKIKKLRRDGKIPFEEMLIHQSMPFAIFLFIGFLLTLFFKTDVFHVLFI